MDAGRCRACPLVQAEMMVNRLKFRRQSVLSVVEVMALIGVGIVFILALVYVCVKRWEETKLIDLPSTNRLIARAEWADARKNRGVRSAKAREIVACRQLLRGWKWEKVMTLLYSSLGVVETIVVDEQLDGNRYADEVCGWLEQAIQLLEDEQ